MNDAEHAAYEKGRAAGKERDFTPAVFNTPEEHNAYTLGWAAGRKNYQKED